MSKALLVTGSSGLIGSEFCVHFARDLSHTVHGGDIHHVQTVARSNLE
jgi:CDP-paratose 2-epimerase